MAMVQMVNSELFWPARTPLATTKAVTGTTAADRTFAASMTMNDSGDDAHFTGYIRWADGGSNKAVTAIYFVPTTVSSPIGTLRVGLQAPLAGVQAKRGNGTFLRYGDLSSTVLVADAVAQVTMTTGTQVYSDGDYAAISVAWASYVSGSFEFKMFSRVLDTTQMPASTLNTAYSVATLPNILLLAADGVFGTLQGAGWGVSSSHVGFTAASSPNEYGNRFTCPARMMVNGIWVRRSISNVLGMSFYAGIYDDNGTLISGRLIGPSENASAVSAYRFDTYQIPAATLEAGSTYVVAIRAADTDTVGVEFVATGSPAYMTPFPGGDSVNAASRSGGSGTFQTYAAGQFTMGVAISAIDDGAGAGWIPGVGASGNTLKVLFDPSALGATTISGSVFAAPSGSDMTGPKIGEFTGEVVEAALEDGKAVLKVPVSAFGGTGLLLTDNPVVLLRNAEYTTGYVNATVINE